MPGKTLRHLGEGEEGFVNKEDLALSWNCLWFLSLDAPLHSLPCDNLCVKVTRSKGRYKISLVGDRAAVWDTSAYKRHFPIDSWVLVSR